MSKRVGDDTSRRGKASGKTAYNLMEEGGEVILSPEEKTKELDDNTAANAMYSHVSRYKPKEQQKETLYSPH